MVDQLKHIISGEDYKINDKIIIHNPTIKEIKELGEIQYNNFVYGCLLARPYDYAVELDDAGIDYAEISNYQMFCQLIVGIPKDISKILFKDINFEKFRLAVNNQNNFIVLYNEEEDIIIDEAIYYDIVSFIKEIHKAKLKEEYKWATTWGRKKYIKEERNKKNRALRRKQKDSASMYSNIISALVNCESFKYNYKSVFLLHISQLMDAAFRMTSYKEISNIMRGIYVGMIDNKKIDPSKLNWFGDIKIDQEPQK